MSTPSGLATRIRTLVQHRLTSLSRERRFLLNGQERDVVELLTDNLLHCKALSCKYCRAKFLPCTGISGYYGCIFCISDHEECQWEPSAPELNPSLDGKRTDVPTQLSNQNSGQFIADDTGASDSSSDCAVSSSSDSEIGEESWPEEHIFLSETEADWSSIDSSDDEDYASSADTEDSSDRYGAPSPCPFSVVEKAALQPIAFFMDPSMNPQRQLGEDNRDPRALSHSDSQLDSNNAVTNANNITPERTSNALFFDELSTVHIPDPSARHAHAGQMDNISELNLGPSLFGFPFDPIFSGGSSLSLALQGSLVNPQPFEGALNPPRPIGTLDSWASDYQGNGTLLSNQVDTLSQEPGLFYGYSTNPFTPHYGVLQQDPQQLPYETGGNFMDEYNTFNAFNFNAFPIPPDGGHNVES